MITEKRLHSFKINNSATYNTTSFCSYARLAQPCPIRRLGPLKSAETRVIKHPI